MGIYPLRFVGRGGHMRYGSVSAVIVAIWLIIGVLAAGQRGYFSTSTENCAKAGTTIVTILVGPLNYFGVNPKVHCQAPQPSKCRRGSAGIERSSVDVHGPLGNGRPGELLDRPLPPGPAQLGGALGLGEQLGDGGGEVRDKPIRINGGTGAVAGLFDRDQ